MLRETGDPVSRAELSTAHQDGMMRAQHLSRQATAPWSGTYPIPDAQGRQIARHIKVDDSLTFIPGEPGAGSYGIVTAGAVALVLGIITLGSALGFSHSVEDFPAQAVAPMLGSGGGVTALGILLIVFHVLRSKKRKSEAPFDGVYLFYDALLHHNGKTVSVYPRDAILGIEVKVVVSGQANPMGGQGTATEFHRSRIRFRKRDGGEGEKILPLYPYTITGSAPLDPILKEWLQ